jgi:hypothetical protein
VGGEFTAVGGVATDHVAKWNGTAWSALNTGISTDVDALAVDTSGTVYAGWGLGSQGGTAPNQIARWNGATWSALGAGINDNVETLLANGSNLYVGGYFSIIGGIAANSIAKWSGSTWSALGAGVTNITSNRPGVHAIAVGNRNTVYAGGSFTLAGGSITNYLAQWDGTTWSAVGSRPTGQVEALVVDSNNNLYAAGAFTNVGGIAANHIAKWNGTAWSALGAGINGDIDAMVVDANGNLYVGGDFTTAGGVTVNNIAKWNGTNWVSLGAGVNDEVRALAVDGCGNVYIGGDFTTAGGLSASHIAMWNGIGWSALAALRVYHLPQPSNTSLRTSLDHQAVGAIKVVADNADATVLSVAYTCGRNISLRLQENPSNASFGPLADATGYFLKLTTSTTNAEVLYHHPAYLDANGSHKNLHVEVVETITPNTSVILQTYILQVLRPPLMLVHGLWSSGEAAFPDLKSKLVADGLFDSQTQITYAEYANDRSFAYNAQKIIFYKKGILSEWAQKQISVSKIDVIGHSMGGVLTRQYIQSNDYQQDINKLITLNTPHGGSPIPIFVRSLPSSVKQWLADNEHDPDKGAIADLSYKSAEIARINSVTNTKGVALHSISTNIQFSPQLPIQQIFNRNLGWEGLMIGWMAITQPKATFVLNTFLTNYIFQDDYDIVVGVNSQKGGLLGLYTNNIAGQHHSSGGNVTVQNKIEELIRANSNDGPTTNLFTKAGFRPVQVNSILQRGVSPTLLQGSHRLTSTLQIISPIRSTLVTDPDSILVAVTASPDITKVLFICSTSTSVLTTKLLPTASGTTYLHVPKHGLGRLKIAAFAFADSVYVQYDTLSTRLTTNATLTSIRLEPNLVYTVQGDSTLIRAVGTYSDGIERNVLGQFGLQFVVRSNKVRISRKGWVIGLNAGVDSLRASYGGYATTIPVEVEAKQSIGLTTQSQTVRQIALWPNPAQQSVQVSGALNAPIQLFNLLGSVVRIQTSVKDFENIFIDLQGLPKGVYIMRIGATTRRLLIE